MLSNPAELADNGVLNLLLEFHLWKMTQMT